MKATHQNDVRGSTLEFWQPHYPCEELSTVDADSMIRGVSEFISILAEWEAAEDERKARRSLTRRRFALLRTKTRRDLTAANIGGAV